MNVFQLLPHLRRFRRAVVALTPAFFTCIHGASAASLDGPARSWVESLPRSFHDVEALCETIRTPDEAFRFVKEQVAYEPYQGCLKGARGTLLTRGGNDVDRALLLARLLSAQGHEVSLLRRALAPHESAALLETWRRAPGAVDLLLRATPANLPAQASAEAQTRRAVFLKRVQERRQQLEAAADACLTLLKGVAPGAAPERLAAPREHVWVRATIEDRVLDFDPLLGAAPTEPTLLGEPESWSIDSMPDELFQRIRIRMVAERLSSDGSLGEQELLSQEYRSADLVGSNVRLAVLPTGTQSGITEFRPILLVGQDILQGSGFLVTGAPAQAAEPMGGLFGALGGSEEPEEPPADAGDAPKLARLRVDFVFTAPGLPEETFSRMLVDRLNGKAGSWSLVPELREDRAIRPLLAQIWETTLDVGAPHPVWLMQTELDSIATWRPLEEAQRTGRLSAADMVPLPPPPQLVGFSFASGVAQTGTAQARRIHLRPRLLVWRHGHAIRDWTAPGAGLRYEEGIDLINAPFAFEGPASREAALRSGVTDTCLELHATARDRVFNALPFFAAAEQQGVAVETITADEATRLDDIALPGPVRLAIANDLARHHTVVMPRGAVSLHGSNVFGWWSVDPATAYAVGRMELGGSQGLAEASQMNEKITQWTEIYVKFMGNILRCYGTELANTLGSVEPDLKRMDVKVTLNHGDGDPLPEVQTLLGCLRSAACEALKDFVEAELNGAALFGEAQTVREMIAKWVEQKAMSEAADASGAACESLLGGGDK